jgi:hypothetical protein
MGLKPSPKAIFLPLAQGFVPGRKQFFEALPHAKGAAIGGPEFQCQPPVRTFAQ